MEIFAAVSALGDIFCGKEVVCLPKEDQTGEDRPKAVEEMREKYRWRHTGCGNASMIDGLPLPNELPHLGWVQGLLKVIIKALRNKRAAAQNSQSSQSSEDEDDSDARCVTSHASELIRSILTGNVSEADIDKAIIGLGDISCDDSLDEIQGNHFEEFRRLYATLREDVVCERDQFLDDDIFGWYRIAGANCLRLHKICVEKTKEKFPDLTDETFRAIKGFERDNLQNAADSERLYFVEYPELDGMAETKRGRYIYAPLALFAVPLNPENLRESLLPIAIRCKPSLPMFTPCSNKLAWYTARSMVQTSDALTQAVMYHLGRSHLLIEVFNCATHRALAKTHPLYKLLLQHFYGTAFMNYAATKTLIMEEHHVDQIVSPAMSELRNLAADSITNRETFSFNDWMVDKELAGRGVMSEKLKYPYRDDALKLWGAILKWAGVFVGAYYKSNDDVKDDRELQAWCYEVSDREHGNLPGFGDENGKILTKETLVRTVAMIIYTASAMHAATNFPQGTVMQFAPAMSLGGYAQPLEKPEPYKDMDDFKSNVMPPIQACATQMFVAEVLGTYRYTKLGEYRDELKFAPKSVQIGLKEFQDELDDIAVDVSSRNKEERKLKLPSFNYLDPNKIPQSINI